MRHLVILVLALAAGPVVAQKKAMTFEDVMRFLHLHDPVVSEDGTWVAYELRPDRGDGLVRVRSLRTEASCDVPRGASPKISPDGRWVVCQLVAALAERDAAAAKKGGKKPGSGLAILDTSNGKVVRLPRVRAHGMSRDGRWVAALTEPEEEGSSEAAKEGEGDQDAGTLVLRRLADGYQRSVPATRSFVLDPNSAHVAVVTGSAGKKGLSVLALDAKDTAPVELVVDAADVTHPTWSRKGSRLAFVRGTKDGDDVRSEILSWTAGAEATVLVGGSHVPSGWHVPSENALRFTRDGKRLVFGLRPRSEGDRPSPESDDPYDVSTLLKERAVDVWHWNDPLIVPHQKKGWKKESKRTWAAVVHLDVGRVQPLATRALPDVMVEDNAAWALGEDPQPYRREVTWIGNLRDVYAVSQETGVAHRIASRLRGTVSLAPAGDAYAFYEAGHWFLGRAGQGAARNVTEALGVPFANEDHDYPAPAPGYGVAGWLRDGSAVLLYDKYDVWQVAVDGSRVVCLTASAGRRDRIVYRIVDIKDPEDAPGFSPGEQLLLTGHDETKKTRSFYASWVGRPGALLLRDAGGKLTFVARARRAGTLLFTHETYREYPDLRVADPWFRHERKVSDANPQISRFGWGNARLVTWTSLDGKPLQGALIEPEGKRPPNGWPTVVYFYRFYSQRVCEFNQVVVNHRPCFPFYASNGYAVFLPDIRFEVGRPGFAATKCLVPGVQHLVREGISDPRALGLHGHSWGGYQTAFIITQTDIFKAAVAGAPVSNMTSAYSGIRWRSGRARQFQYEQSQSRLGGSLWEARDRYIDNSPVFFADRIATPLLIQFGDEDGAVPWYQGIELYLALRRLDKDCVFLQYRGEGHHLKKYANKLDYARKMKQYFDHYLKGMPAASWIKSGVPHRGK